MSTFTGEYKPGVLATLLEQREKMWSGEAEEEKALKEALEGQRRQQHEDWQKFLSRLAAYNEAHVRTLIRADDTVSVGCSGPIKFSEITLPECVAKELIEEYGAMLVGDEVV